MLLCCLTKILNYDPKKILNCLQFTIMAPAFFYTYLLRGVCMCVREIFLNVCLVVLVPHH